MVSDRQDPPDMKKKERHGKSRIRNSLELLAAGLDRSEVPEDTYEILKKCCPSPRNGDWCKLMTSKFNQDSGKESSPGNEKTLFSKPSGSVCQSPYAQTSEGRENLLMKGDVASPSEQSDLHFSADDCNLPVLQPALLVEKLDNGALELSTNCTYRVLNGDAANTSTPIRRSKFFVRSPPLRDLRGTASRVGSRKCLDKLFHSRKFGGKPDATLPENGSSELMTYHRSCALNGDTVTALKPIQKSKCFASHQWDFTQCSSDAHSTVNGVSSGKYLNREFGGKTNGTSLEKGSTSEEIVPDESSLSTNARDNSLQLSDCVAKLDEKRPMSETNVQESGIYEERSPLKEIRPASKTELGSCAKKRKASPLKDNCIVKVRRTGGYAEDREKGARNNDRISLVGWPEEYKKTHQNEQLNPENGSVLNRINPVEEASKIIVECGQVCSVHNRREGAAPVLVSDSGSSTNCSAVQSPTRSRESNVSGSSSECQRTRHSTSLQPVIVLRKLTCSEIRHYSSLQPVVELRKLTSYEIGYYTSKKRTQREKISHNCIGQGEAVGHLEKSDEGAPYFCLEKWNKIFPEGYRKRCVEFLKSNASSSEDRDMGQPSEQQKHEDVESVCETERQKSATKIPGSDVVWNGVTNSTQNGESGHHVCNGEIENVFGEIIRCTDLEDTDSEYGNTGDFSNREVLSLDFSAEEGIQPFTILTPDKRGTGSALKMKVGRSSVGNQNNKTVSSKISADTDAYRPSHNRAPAVRLSECSVRKCCRNAICRVATPELVGLENPITSNRCWMNVTLQTLFSMENFMHSMVRAFEEVNVEDNSLLSCILTLYYARSLGHQDCVYEQASKLAEVLGTLNSDYILNEQQDPSEFILWLFNAFEPALEKYGPSWASSLITENFRFEMEERTVCVGCLNVDVNTSSFLILMLDIHIGTSKISTIQEALTAYTSTKKIRKTCSQCGEDHSLVKTAFKSIPRYLIINLKRYSVEGGEVIRDETPVKHSNSLSLGSYSVSNCVYNCSEARSSEPVTSPPKLNISKKSLRSAPGDCNLISVIHHSGCSVSSGHYVCDVYHRRTDKWYSYNDKMVKEIQQVTLSRMKRQRTGYIYVYQNKNG